MGHCAGTEVDVFFIADKPYPFCLLDRMKSVEKEEMGKHELSQPIFDTHIHQCGIKTFIK
jgi:hypothetical protein